MLRCFFFSFGRQDTCRDDGTMTTLEMMLVLVFEDRKWDGSIPTVNDPVVVVIFVVVDTDVDADADADADVDADADTVTVVVSSIGA